MTEPRDGQRRIALTFDAEHPDRPTDAGLQESLIEFLADRDIPATFFIQGRWAEAYPRTARLVAEAGHLVGSHSFYHARMPLLSDTGLDTDVRDAERVITDIVGVDPRPWFRCPFGSGFDDPRVLGRLEALGYRDIGWHVTPDDWDPDSTPVSVTERVMAGTREHGDGAIVLFHTWPRPTLPALRDLIVRLRDQGASFVRVDELDPVPSTTGT